MKEMLSHKAVHSRMQDPHETNLTLVSSEKNQDQSMRIKEQACMADSTRIMKRASLPSITIAAPPSKKAKQTQNFLIAGAKKAKAAQSARTAARVGFERARMKFSNTGSGVPISQVIRLKYVKGFTQAVRTPFRLEDLSK